MNIVCWLHTCVCATILGSITPFCLDTKDTTIYIYGILCRLRHSKCSHLEEMIPIMHALFLNIASKMHDRSPEELQATCLASCFVSRRGTVVPGGFVGIN